MQVGQEQLILFDERIEYGLSESFRKQRVRIVDELSEDKTRGIDKSTKHRKLRWDGFDRRCFLASQLEVFAIDIHERNLDRCNKLQPNGGRRAGLVMFSDGEKQ